MGAGEAGKLQDGVETRFFCATDIGGQTVPDKDCILGATVELVERSLEVELVRFANDTRGDATGGLDKGNDRPCARSDCSIGR